MIFAYLQPLRIYTPHIRFKFCSPNISQDPRMGWTVREDAERFTPKCSAVPNKMLSRTKRELGAPNDFYLSNISPERFISRTFLLDFCMRELGAPHAEQRENRAPGHFCNLIWGNAQLWLETTIPNYTKYRLICWYLII